MTAPSGQTAGVRIRFWSLLLSKLRTAVDALGPAQEESVRRLAHVMLGVTPSACVIATALRGRGFGTPIEHRLPQPSARQARAAAEGRERLAQARRLHPPTRPVHPLTPRRPALRRARGQMRR